MNPRPLSLCAALLFACGTSGLEHDGGTGGGGGFGGSSGGGSAGGGHSGGGLQDGGTGGGAQGGGSTTACDGLDEPTCAGTIGCVADTCIECTCKPVYLGCRAGSALPHMCPLLNCPSPACCRNMGDCSMAGGSCAEPGVTQLGCGVCQMTPGDCAADGDCATGKICDPIQCSCIAASHCVDGCNGTCDEGTVCQLTAAHPRCTPASCSASQPCPPSFTCTSGACARKTCSGKDAGADNECDPLGESYCVQGFCYPSLGQCLTPVP